MRVLAVEYAVAGFAGGGEIALEGYAMLRSLLADLRLAGHEVVTIVSPVYAALCDLPASSIASLSGDLVEALLREAVASDAVILIAPALKRALPALISALHSAGANVVGPKPEAAALCSDKLALYRRLSKCGVPVPRTIHVDFDEARSLKAARELGFPVVVKPRDGIGCAGLSLAADEQSLLAAISRVRDETESDGFLLQEYVAGLHASACVIVNPADDAIPISANGQLIELGPHASSYGGGFVPLRGYEASEVIKAALSAVESISGLRGFVGVDVVLGEAGPVVVDVNPRLTTSYVGARRIVKTNLAQLMLRPRGERVECRGAAIYVKLEVERLPARLGSYALLDSGEVYVNPVALTGSAVREAALTVAWAPSLEGARQRLNFIAEQLGARPLVDFKQ